MLMELKNGRFANDIASAQEVGAFVDEAVRMIRAYGWRDRTVSPWGHAENVTKTVAYISDYSKCTLSSKQVLISLANGLARIMNAWEQQEINGVSVKNVCTGRVVKIEKDMLDIYLSNGFVRV